MPTEKRPVADRPRTSTRGTSELVQLLASWLAPQIRADSVPVVERVRSPDAAGFSGDTILFDLRWQVDGERRMGSFVLRLPPPDNAFPLFLRYELDRQGAAMRYVRERSNVPVPAVPWSRPR